MSKSRGVFNGALVSIPIWIILYLLLAGCTTTCTTCVGPYDLGLSSHREALGLTGNR